MGGNRKINYKNKKNSFFSENNQLLKNKIFKHNLIDSQKHMKKIKNYNIKTDNLNKYFIYKKLSGKNINHFKLNKKKIF